MQIAIRTIGNSKGVVPPKPLLAQAGLADQTQASVAVEDGAIILRKIKRPSRQGWADEARAIAAQGEDVLLMGEFANADDQDMRW